MLGKMAHYGGTQRARAMSEGHCSSDVGMAPAWAGRPPTGPSVGGTGNHYKPVMVARAADSNPFGIPGSRTVPVGSPTDPAGSVAASPERDGSPKRGRSLRAFDLGAASPPRFRPMPAEGLVAAPPSSASPFDPHQVTHALRSIDAHIVMMKEWMGHMGKTPDENFQLAWDMLQAKAPLEGFEAYKKETQEQGDRMMSAFISKSAEIDANCCLRLLMSSTQKHSVLESTHATLNQFVSAISHELQQQMARIEQTHDVNVRICEQLTSETKSSLRQLESVFWEHLRAHESADSSKNGATQDATCNNDRNACGCCEFCTRELAALGEEISWTDCRIDTLNAHVTKLCVDVRELNVKFATKFCCVCEAK